MKINNKKANWRGSSAWQNNRERDDEYRGGGGGVKSMAWREKRARNQRGVSA